MRIGIFTAMEKEAKSFLQHADVTLVEDDVCKVYSFKLGGKDSFLCCSPAPGEIFTTIAVQKLILQYKVDVVINFGVVGALTDKMSLQSFVYVNSVVHYDMDSSAIDDLPVGKYPCFDDVAVPTDEDLLKKALSINNLPVVRCASADKFVAEPSSKSYLHEEFSADICDMESAGVLFTCKANNVPCLLVKCISDSLFGGKKEYWQTVMQATEGFFGFAEKLILSL